MASATLQTSLPAYQSESHQRPNLLTIPRELRDLIIAPLLQSGDLSILRVCPAITEEALQRITHEATFRVYFSIKGHEDTVLGRATIPAGIQNVEVRFELPPAGYAIDEEIIEYNGGESLDYIYQATKLREIRPRGSQILLMLSYELCGYKHFDTLVIKVVRSYRDEYWTSSLERRLHIDTTDAKVLEDCMGHALGPTTLSANGANFSVEFHPREYWSGRKVDLLGTEIPTTTTANRCRPWYPALTDRW